MEFTQSEKEVLENKIADILLIGVDNGTLTENDVPLISYFVLEHIDLITTKEEATAFIHQLSTKWPIFTTLQTIDRRQERSDKEKDAVDNVALLTKQGKLEEALQIAKSATQQ